MADLGGTMGRRWSSIPELTGLNVEYLAGVKVGMSALPGGR